MISGMRMTSWYNLKKKKLLPGSLQPVLPQKRKIYISILTVHLQVRQIKNPPIPMMCIPTAMWTNLPTNMKKSSMIMMMPMIIGKMPWNKRFKVA